MDVLGSFSARNIVKHQAEILAISVIQRGFSGKQRILEDIGWGTEDLICIENATDFFCSAFIAQNNDA